MRRKRVGQPFRLNVTIPTWLIIAGCAAVLLIIYLFAKHQRDHVKFVGAVIGGSAAIYSAYYVGAALRTRIERDRQDSTFRILDSVTKSEFLEVRNFLEKEVEDHENQSSADLYKKISENRDLDNAITLVFNTFERIAIGIKYDVLDEDILYEDLVLVVDKNYSSLRGYIDQLRKVKNNTLYFCEFEKLAAAWHKGKRFSDGKDFAPLSNS
jgi:hypothetical protein